jgi:hypothetical protein
MIEEFYCAVCDEPCDKPEETIYGQYYSPLCEKHTEQAWERQQTEYYQDRGPMPAQEETR